MSRINRFVLTAGLSGLVALLLAGKRDGLGRRGGEAGRARRAGGAPDFGPNVKIFDPSMPTSQIQADGRRDRRPAGRQPVRAAALRAAVQARHLRHRRPSRSTSRSATTPSVAGPRRCRRTTSSSTGRSTCATSATPSSCIALEQLLALAVEPDHQRHQPDVGCYTGEFWAVSQAAPMRRVHVNGLDDADGLLHRPVVRERRLHRRLAVRRQHRDQRLAAAVARPRTARSTAGRTASGTRSSPASSARRPSASRATASCGGPYTTLADEPGDRERRRSSTSTRPATTASSSRRRGTTPAGTTWASGPTAGCSIPIDDSSSPARRRRRRRSTTRWPAGQNLILTPGVYDVDKTIKVKRADTVVLGLGFPTLDADQTATSPMTVADVPGVDIAGLIFDAGPKNSPVLLQVGTAERAQERPPHDPTALQDVFFRIGGAAAGKATVEPRGEQRQHDPRRHLGLARRPRQRRRLDGQHRRHRRGRQRRRRDGVRPVRRALPEVRGDLERQARHGRSSSRTRCRTTRRARRRGWRPRASTATPPSRSPTR